MTRMAWAFPTFPELCFCLIPAALAYIIAVGYEGARAGEQIKLLFFFGACFFFGLGFLPILVFPLMLLILPLCLVAKLASGSKRTRVVAALGLVPFLIVAGKGKWESSQGGPLYKMDKVQIPRHYPATTSELGLPDLTEEQLIGYLTEGPEQRRRNAAVLLKAEIRGESDARGLEETLEAIKEQVGADREKYVQDLIGAYEWAIERKAKPKKTK